MVQELLLRHRARSALVVCPASLQLQWRDELREKFGLEFRIVDRELLGVRLDEPRSRPSGRALGSNDQHRPKRQTHLPADPPDDRCGADKGGPRERDRLAPPLRVREP